MLGTNTSTLPTLKVDLSDHTIIKDDIFEVNVNFPPRGTPIGIVTQYCEQHNISYISQSENNIPWYHKFPYRKSDTVWFLSIDRKDSTTVQQFLESISCHKLTGKCNKVHVITAHRDKDIIRTNLQESRCIFNQIRHIQAVGNKRIILPTKHTTPDNIGDVGNSPLKYEWYESIFQTIIKWQHPQHSVHNFYVYYSRQTQRYSDPEYNLG